MDGRFPEKLFYRIGDVSEITEIKPHVLRYWESEFSGLHPRKNRAGQRIYERRDVELVLEIKKLLYDQRYTISGARKLLTRQAKRASKKSSLAKGSADIAQVLKTCCQELRALLTLLGQDESSDSGGRESTQGRHMAHRGMPARSDDTRRDARK